MSLDKEGRGRVARRSSSIWAASARFLLGVYITLQRFALGLQTVGLELRELRASQSVVISTPLRVPSRRFELPL